MVAAISLGPAMDRLSLDPLLRLKPEFQSLTNLLGDVTCAMSVGTAEETRHRECGGLVGGCDCILCRQ